MVLPRAFGPIPALHAFVEQFGKVSVLLLDVPETVVVPLDPLDELAVRRAIGSSMPAWAGLSVAADTKKLS
eukprot:2380535-Pyramimonas_sp.AAC.1